MVLFFLPEVVFVPQDSVLQIFCPNHKDLKEKMCYSLDVVQTVQLYFEMQIPGLFYLRDLAKVRLLLNYF